MAWGDSDWFVFLLGATVMVIGLALPIPNVALASLFMAGWVFSDAITGHLRSPLFYLVWSAIAMGWGVVTDYFWRT